MVPHSSCPKGWERDMTKRGAHGKRLCVWVPISKKAWNNKRAGMDRNLDFWEWFVRS